MKVVKHNADGCLMGKENRKKIILLVFKKLTKSGFLNNFTCFLFFPPAALQTWVGKTGLNWAFLFKCLGPGEQLVLGNHQP